MNDETEIRDNNHGENPFANIILRFLCIPLLPGDDDDKKEKDLKSQKRSIIQFLFSQ